MRTTLRLYDDIHRAACSLAAQEGKSVGAVVSELVRKALAPPPRRRAPGPFPRFRVPVRAAPITPEMVKRALEEP
jgi:hypothetical protein